MERFSLNQLPVLLGVLLSTIFISCEEQAGEINLSENAEQRQEVYQQILSDEELFGEFMAEMREDPEVMRNVYTREQVEASMMADPKVMDSVMVGLYAVVEQDTLLLSNPERRERMMQYMTTIMVRDTALFREVRERMMEENIEE